MKMNQKIRHERTMAIFNMKKQIKEQLENASLLHGLDFAHEMERSGTWREIQWLLKRAYDLIDYVEPNL